MAQPREAARNGALAVALTRAGLDALDFGFAIFDVDLKLVASNRAFQTLRGYPASLCKPGTGVVEFSGRPAPREHDRSRGFSTPDPAAAQPSVRQAGPPKDRSQGIGRPSRRSR